MISTSSRTAPFLQTTSWIYSTVCPQPQTANQVHWTFPSMPVSLCCHGMRINIRTSVFVHPPIARPTHMHTRARARPHGNQHLSLRPPRLLRPRRLRLRALSPPVHLPAPHRQAPHRRTPHFRVPPMQRQTPPPAAVAAAAMRCVNRAYSGVETV